jgi:hypothetical protein
MEDSTRDVIRVQIADKSGLLHISNLLLKSRNKETAKHRKQIVRCLMNIYLNPDMVEQLPHIGYYLFSDSDYSRPFLKIENTAAEPVFDPIGQKWLFVRAVMR